MSTLLTPTTELDAINRMLGSIGQSPVNSTTVSGEPDVTSALAYLNEELLDLEATGWSWNTDRNYTLTPDVDGYIQIPTGALEVDPEDVTLNYVVRLNPANSTDCLYKADEQTFTFDATETVDCKIVWGFPFDEIPQAARTYVAIRASRKFQAQKVSSAPLDAFNDKDEKRAWARLLRMERRVRDTNTFRQNVGAQRALRRHF